MTRKITVRTVQVIVVTRDVCPKCGNSLHWTCQDCRIAKTRQTLRRQRAEWRIW